MATQVHGTVKDTTNATLHNSLFLLKTLSSQDGIIEISGPDPLLRKKIIEEITIGFLEDPSKEVLWLDCEGLLDKGDLSQIMSKSGFSNQKIQEKRRRVIHKCPKGFDDLWVKLFFGSWTRFPGLVVLVSPLHFLGWGFGVPEGNTVKAGLLGSFMRNFQEECKKQGSIGIISNDLVDKNPRSGVSRSILGEVVSEFVSSKIFLKP